MGIPQGPRQPAWLQLLRYQRNPVGLLESSRRRHGSAFTLRITGIGRMVIVTEPEDLKTVLTGDPKVFHAGKAHELLEPILGPRSVLLAEEGVHLRKRKLMLPPLHGEAVRRYAARVHAITGQEVDSWPVGEPFRLWPRMQAVTLEVILRIVFGLDDRRRLGEMRERLTHMLEPYPGNLVVWLTWLRRDFGRFSPWADFERRREAVDEVFYDEIRRRRAAEDLEERDDVLSLLIKARDEDGRGFGDDELRDELLTLLVTGHETTATGLAWLFERLVRHPEVERRVRAGIEAQDDTYLDAVINETLRLRPPVVDAGRVLTEPAEVAGHLMPAGTLLITSIVLAHRNPAVFADPERFRPERFLDDGKRPPYSFIPFGGGVRRCLGAAFAAFEMKQMIHTILPRVELRPARREDEPIKLLGVTLVPRRGTEVVMGSRTPAPEPSEELRTAA